MEPRRVQRSATTEYRDERITRAEPITEFRRSMSIDSCEEEVIRKAVTELTAGSFKRRSIRRRSSKRHDRSESQYGHDTAAYEDIRKRVLKERAVTNAIEALQERWRMLKYMFDDCVDLNEGRKGRKIRKLNIKRQSELIIIIFLFFTTCVPIFVILVLLCR